MKRLVFLMVAVIASAQSMPAFSATKFVLPTKAHNLSPGEVRKTYSDHTWIWGTGGAYFEPDGKFIAVAGEGESVNIATGRWLVTTGGRLCFDAYWSALKYTAAKALTCFNHAEFKGQIYQAKGMSGKWYTIKSATPKAYDMLNQVVAGDQVSCKFIMSANQLKHRLNAAQVSVLARIKKDSNSCSVSKKGTVT